ENGLLIMENKHTEGPWCVEAGMVFGTQGNCPRICTPCSVEYKNDDSISGHQDMYEAAANAKLIAAAPEMLEVLEYALDDLREWLILYPHEAKTLDIVKDLKRVIKKARW